jgi:hypothetical protein
VLGEEDDEPEDDEEEPDASLLLSEEEEEDTESQLLEFEGMLDDDVLRWSMEVGGRAEGLSSNISF